MCVLRCWSPSERTRIALINKRSSGCTLFSDFFCMKETLTSQPEYVQNPGRRPGIRRRTCPPCSRVCVARAPGASNYKRVNSCQLSSLPFYSSAPCVHIKVRSQKKRSFPHPIFTNEFLLIFGGGGAFLLRLGVVSLYTHCVWLLVGLSTHTPVAVWNIRRLLCIIPPPVCVRNKRGCRPRVSLPRSTTPHTRRNGAMTWETIGRLLVLHTTIKQSELRDGSCSPTPQLL